MTPPMLPETPDYTALYWERLAEGQLAFARCGHCGHAWLPVSRECPQCHAAAWRFEVASGRATLLSWVIYHHAYNELWADRVPYVVALVQLVEGPRLTSNLIGDLTGAELQMDQPLQLVIEDERGTAVPRFTPVDPPLRKAVFGDERG